MNIQIDHTSFDNLGAELMHDAIIDAFATQKYKEISFYAGKGLRKEPIKKLKQANIKYQNLPFFLRLLNRLAQTQKFEPWNYGFLLNNDIDIVLDAGGFRFGDKWKHTKEKNFKLEKYYRKLKQNGTKLIFMPQAFGPFTKEESKNAIKIIHTYADLIFARDKISQDYLMAEFPGSKKIRFAKDFTNLYHPQDNQEIAREYQNKVCLIPNSRMLKRVDTEVSEAYLKNIDKFIKLLIENNTDLFVVSFNDREDLALCRKIAEKHANKKNIPVLHSLKAKEAKIIINSSRAVYSSRFHGAVCAMSQAIPCATSSWSHKYEMLFSDYGLDNFVMNQNNTIENIFEELILEPGNTEIRNKLKNKTLQLQEETKKFWKDIFEYITPDE